MAKTTIVVEQRSEDYMAYIEGHKEYWDRGKTIQSAIGSLMLTHRDQFDVEIKTPEIKPT